jgi:hypothetical protein
MKPINLIFALLFLLSALSADEVLVVKQLGYLRRIVQIDGKNVYQEGFKIVNEDGTVTILWKAKQ